MFTGAAMNLEYLNSLRGENKSKVQLENGEKVLPALKNATLRS